VPETASAESHPDRVARGPSGRLRGLRSRVHAVPGGRLVWRIAITVLGVSIVLIGIVLLPLPGPGWLIIFAGLGVLATEYVWAHRLLRRARTMVTAWTRWALRQSLWVRALITIGGLLLLAAALAGTWELSRLV
jgi:uncharacterized protein (TIGR02611 family)